MYTVYPFHRALERLPLTPDKARELAIEGLGMAIEVLTYAKKTLEPEKQPNSEKPGEDSTAELADISEPTIIEDLQTIDGNDGVVHAVPLNFDNTSVIAVREGPVTGPRDAASYDVINIVPRSDPNRRTTLLV